MFISSGTNSDLRYNAFYPRWAYDQYRDLLAAAGGAITAGAISTGGIASTPDEFTDSPVHLTPAGSRQLSGWLGEAIIEVSS